MENASFTCTNPLCRRIFVSPLKAVVHGAAKVEPYDACPYCLTAVTLDSSIFESDGRESSDAPKIGAEHSRRVNVKKEFNLEALPTNSTNVSGCQHSFGYLSKRAANEKIPEECITCKDLVECMLKAA